jgi:hypothetical protein
VFWEQEVVHLFKLGRAIKFLGGTLK